MCFDVVQCIFMVVVDFDSYGECIFIFMVCLSVDLFFQFEDFLLFVVGQWLYVCFIVFSVELSCSMIFVVMEVIKCVGGYVSFDFNICSDLWQDLQDFCDCFDWVLVFVDVIKFLEEELVFIIGSDDIVSGIVWLNVCFQLMLLLVIQGKVGVQVVLCGQVSYFFVCLVVVVDIIGVGDVFVVGLFVGFVVYGILDNFVVLVFDFVLV